MANWMDEAFPDRKPDELIVPIRGTGKCQIVSVEGYEDTAAEEVLKIDQYLLKYYAAYADEYESTAEAVIALIDLADKIVGEVREFIKDVKDDKEEVDPESAVRDWPKVQGAEP